MADSDRRVVPEEEHRERPSHDETAPHDHRALSVHRHFIGAERLHHSLRRTGRKACLFPRKDAGNVDRRNTVQIFFGINHLLGPPHIQLLRQRL